MSERKLLVIDTSVLLYDAESIYQFTGNDVILPMIVLEELDRFKEKQGTVGSNARLVNRYLDELREIGSLSTGINLKDKDIVIRVSNEERRHDLPDAFPANQGDNRIISSALALRANYPDKKVKVVTKDINLRVKCDALGLEAEDYYRDLPISVRDGNPIHSGVLHVTLDKDAIDHFYADDGVPLDATGVNPELFIQNSLVVGTTPEGQSLIGMVKDDKIVPPRTLGDSMIQVKPRSKEQRAAMHLLTDPDVPLVALTGLAGSGKTFLALTVGISGLRNKIYDRIIITRSIEPVGRDIGFLPGTVDEKMAPWLMPIVDNFRNAFHDVSWFEMMREKGEIEVSPITYVRGRSFAKSYIIVDESQNLTIHELKTLITRCGQDTKMVLLGDIDQVDTPYMDRYSNGLTIAIEKLKGQDLFGHIKLDRGERSQLATLASSIL